MNLKKRITFISLFVIVILIIASQCLPRTTMLINEPAPSFNYVDLNDREVDLESLKGKVVFLNFWATWCKSCVNELPHLDELQRTFGKKLTVISIGGFKESEARLRSFLKRRPVTYSVIHLHEGDLDDLVMRYGRFYQIPQTFAIDQAGRIRQVWSESRDHTELTKVAQTLIAETSTPSNLK